MKRFFVLIFKFRSALRHAYVFFDSVSPCIQPVHAAPQLKILLYSKTFISKDLTIAYCWKPLIGALENLQLNFLQPTNCTGLGNEFRIYRSLEKLNQTPKSENSLTISCSRMLQSRNTYHPFFFSSLRKNRSRDTEFCFKRFNEVLRAEVT